MNENDSSGTQIIRPSLLIAILIVVGVLHVCAAWFNVGYIHPDEHFQILEFAKHRLNNSPASDLPWEFSTRLRPTLQPTMAMVVMKALAQVGIESPFTSAFVLRLCSSLAGLVLSLWLCFYSFRWFSDDRVKRLAFYLTCFFWAAPFLHARFSSENWAGLLLFYGVMVLLVASDRVKQPGGMSVLLAVVAGLLFGFAFFCRFQIGLALVGLALWLLLIRRPGARLILVTGGALGAALLLGVLVDRWFYGEWVLTPIRYFDVNLIENRAADWGVQPWWWYFVQLVYQLVPPFSLVLIAAGVVACFRRSRNVLVWIVVSFVLLHMIVGHKEARFLFPLIYALPILPLLALDKLGSSGEALWDRVWRSRTVRVLGYFWIAVNLGGMLVVSLLPANYAVEVQDWLYARGEEAPISVYTLGRDPYLNAGLRMNFYSSPHVTVQKLASLDQLADIVHGSSAPVYFFHEGLTPPRPDTPSSFTLTAETLSLPRPLVDLPWVRRFFLVRLWGIYRCDPA